MNYKALLVVDDHPVYRDAIGDKLKQEFGPQDIEVVVVASAHEGLECVEQDRKSTRLNSSHSQQSRMPSSA